MTALCESLRVLVIGYCYPPTVSPEGFVTAKLLRNLQNCHVDVLTLENGLISEVMDHDMGSYGEQISGSVFSVGISGAIRALFKLPRLPFRPDRWLILNRAVYRRASQLIEEGNYDCLITRSQYHSSHLVGLRLKKRFPGMPWIACFSDPWSRADHQARVPVITRWSEQQERMVLENATKLVFPTVGLRDHFTNALEFYNTKSAVVPHSFDSSLYEVGKPKQIRNSMHLVARLFGAFYGARKPDVLFSAIAGMELGEDINFTLEVYGPWHPAYEELHKLRGVGVNRRIVYRGHVPHVEALREMQDADLLVLVDAPGKGESFYLPSKLVDYMAARRPILALCREGVTRSIVKKLNGIVADPEDESSVHQGLEKWVKSRKDCFIANEDVLADHDAVKVGEKFRSLIREIV